MYLSEEAKLFSLTQGHDQNVNEEAKFQIPSKLFNGQCSIVFANPEALLSKEG